MRVEFYEFGKKKIFENVTLMHEIVERRFDGNTDLIILEYYEQRGDHWLKHVQKVDVTCTTTWKLFPEGDCEEI
ncbi:MAG: hypothetical protein J6S85_22335 [Methanobrevibacter sp.]|nr:hypothetical protein [Methanobrevibacter sp.]